MLGEPCQGGGFGGADPGGFLVGVGVGIIRVEVARAAFFGLVGAGGFGMSTQIVAKGEVTLDLRGIGLEEVKLDDARAGVIGQRAIASSGDAQFAVPLVAKRLDARTLPVEVSQIGDEGHEVEDRFGGQPGTAVEPI